MNNKNNIIKLNLFILYQNIYNKLKNINKK